MGCSWLAQTINGFVALGTLSAVGVALFGNWFRLRYFPPLLRIRLLNNDGEYITMTNRETGAVAGEARYYHLIASNPRRWFAATNTDVRLIQIEEATADGSYRVEWVGDVPIHCRNQSHNPLKHDIGPSKHFDVCSVLNQGSCILLHPILTPNNLRTAWAGPQHLVLSFQARSTEVDSDIVRIKIVWDGKWHEGANEMATHFRISEY